jgi:hypothetical protein
VQSFGLWLRKHGGLLRELAVQVASGKASSPRIAFDSPLPSALFGDDLYKRLQDTTVTELAQALQQAVASNMLQLKSFSLIGAAATCTGWLTGCACL